MKILEFKSENFRRLKVVRIRPSDNMVEITGANDQGKTSALDGLWALLKGRVVAGPEPIRRGAEKAMLSAQLGDTAVRWEVTRTFSRDKHDELTTSLQVVEVDGTQRRSITKSPQAVLDGFLGALSFDPLAFARSRPAEQFELLKAFVPGFDFEKNSAMRKARYDERTELNRERDRARASAQTISARLPPGPKPKRVEIGEALDRLADANATIERNRDERRKRQQRSDAAREKLDEADALRARAVTLEKEANATLSAMALLPPLRKDPDAHAINDEIERIDATNAIVHEHEQHDQLAAAAMLHEQHSQDRTLAIEALDRQRAQAIAAAKMPVEGLTLGDGVVIFNGLPFDQASASTKLKVSCAIAMASNPELRIIRTYDGSLLDKASLGMLAAMAKSRDYQVWIERVDESGEVGFVIDDGELKDG